MRTVPAVDVQLPISLPIGEVFGNRNWTDRNGTVHHKCWFCTSVKPSRKGESYIKDGYPPMPPGCTLCARCGVLIYTGQDDPENEAMAVCRECEAAIERDLAAEDANPGPAA